MSVSVVDHLRTSMSTVIIQKVEYHNFPSESEVFITHYDGEECLGKFPAGKKHTLNNLRKLTTEIKSVAADDFGNVAETTFIVDQNIPAISYERVTRTPSSIFVKGLQLAYFPDKEHVNIAFSCEGMPHVTLPVSDTTYELAGFDQSWEGGTITARASDISNGFTAECRICVEGQGNI